MKSFSQHLNEDKGGKNLHLEHIEDEILNYGVDGGRAAINFVQSLRDMLVGSSRSSMNMTVKWDGAPAIFAGIDPSDGKFFVAKKSVFNTTPKLYKTSAEIDADGLSSGLNSKFKIALAEFSKLDMKGVLQGDLMFTSEDVSTTDIDGASYYTFQPNTIVYAVAVNSDLGKQIKSAKIGVVWHTTYTGSDLQGMKAAFGANIAGLKKPSSVWMDDATYKDVSGSATMTAAETANVTTHLSQAGSTFKTINSGLLKSFLNMQQTTFTGTLVSASLKTYNNSKVRQGEPISDPKKHSVEYLKWVEDAFNKNIDKFKTDNKKKELETLKKEVLRELRKHLYNLTQIITFQNHIVEAKMGIVKKLNTVKSIGTFIKTANGFKVTNPEGYVAIDRVSGNAVKLVDRMEFSYNNFTAIKSWDK
tara:strand:- start:3772 stop:5022 length:1251 start_codon:yes stop_codon:yes gene_type:complete